MVRWKIVILVWILGAFICYLSVLMKLHELVLLAGLLFYIGLAEIAYARKD